MDKNGQNLSGSKTKNLSVYDDGNIPEVDLPLPDDSTQDVIPDEVPRKDGPGGENSNKNNDWLSPAAQGIKRRNGIETACRRIPQHEACRYPLFS